MTNEINYLIIANAIEFYKSKGFEYCNVNWSAPVDILRITTPPRCRLYLLASNDSLVGSAEQSFLDLIINHNLKPGRYVAASPCFRDDADDELHSRYFFKIELIDFENPTIESLQEIIQICQKYFNTFLETEVIQTEEFNWDIVDKKNGIELGSYGLRSHDTIKWIYATGVAEPRLSKVISLNK